MNTKSRDKKIRNQPDNWRDPARDRASHLKLHKHKGPKRSKRPKTPRRGNKAVAIYEPKDYEERHYTDAEKFGIMQAALSTSVEQAAKKYECSSFSIYRWFKEVGGIREVKEYVASRASIGLFKAIDLFVEDLDRRLEEASDEEYFETFRKLLTIARDAGLTVDGGRSGETPGEAQAGRITLNFGSSPPGSEPDENGKPKEEKHVSVFDE